jgi:TonB family protein
VRGSLLLLLALLPAAWAQESRSFGPAVAESSYIIEAPPDVVRALATVLWSDVPFSEAEPDETNRWAAQVVPHERGTVIRLKRYVEFREAIGDPFLPMRALLRVVQSAPLSAATRRLQVKGALSCTARFAQALQVTTNPPELIPNMKDGLEAMYEHLAYPEAAQVQGIEGRVFVTFVIDERGFPNCPIVARGVHPLLDQAAVDAVSTLRFRPGRAGGGTPEVKFSLPIDFCLEGVQSSSEAYNPANCSSARSQRN